MDWVLVNNRVLFPMVWRLQGQDQGASMVRTGEGRLLGGRLPTPHCCGEQRREARSPAAPVRVAVPIRQGPTCIATAFTELLV